MGVGPDRFPGPVYASPVEVHTGAVAVGLVWRLPGPKRFLPALVPASDLVNTSLREADVVDSQWVEGLGGLPGGGELLVVSYLCGPEILGQFLNSVDRGRRSPDAEGMFLEALGRAVNHIVEPRQW